MRRLAVGFALFFASAATSCAFLLDTDELKEGSGEPAAEPIPIEQLPSALAGATCGLLERCTGAALEIYFPEEDCTTVQTRSIEDGFYGVIQLSIEKGRVVYSPEQAGVCAKAFETLACADLDRWPASCDKALAGQVPLDGECGNNIDCQPGAYCDTSGDACPGTCRPQIPVGEPCPVSNEDACVDGLECFKGTCVELPGAGEPCGGGTAPDCELGTLCLNADEGEGQCVVIDDLFRSLEGQSCNLQLGPLCAEGLYCAVTSNDSGQCVPPALSGGDCRLTIPDACPAGEFCNAQLPSLQGVCTSLPGANETCREDPWGLNPPCRPYHRCLGDTCLPLRRLDEACVAHGQCYSGYCEASSGQCKTVGCVF